eukprot:tig00020538_g10324.t1
MAFVAIQPVAPRSFDASVAAKASIRTSFFGRNVAKKATREARPFAAAASETRTIFCADKLKVGVLGATGSVGQKFVQLLEGHPWFDLTFLGASPRSAGKLYADAVNWKQASLLPKDTAALKVTECVPNYFQGCDLVFSGLDADYAGPIEEDFAKAGIPVFSNAKNHRMDDDVPILIPHINADHLNIVAQQKKNRGYDKGFIVTNANCSTTALTIGLKPIMDNFGIEKFIVFTMQAISGAGYPGLPSMDILDNVVPYIGGEEEKMQIEPIKILGKCDGTKFIDAPMTVAAHCNRVHVLDGHTECVSIKLKTPATPEQVKAVMASYTSEAQTLKLPSSPEFPIVVSEEPNRPQPRLDRMRGNGFTVTVGRVRPCQIFDIKFVLFGHNTIIGAAGGSIQNAELAKVKGLL